MTISDENSTSHHNPPPRVHTHRRGIIVLRGRIVSAQWRRADRHGWKLHHHDEMRSQKGVESPVTDAGCMCIGEVIKGCSSAGGWNAFEGGGIFACMQMSSGNAQSLRHPLFWNAVSQKYIILQNFCAQQPDFADNFRLSTRSIIKGWARSSVIQVKGGTGVGWTFPR